MRYGDSNFDSCDCRKRSMRPTEHGDVLVSQRLENAFAGDSVTRLSTKLKKRVNDGVFSKAGSGCGRIETGIGT